MCTHNKFMVLVRRNENRNQAITYKYLHVNSILFSLQVYLGISFYFCNSEKLKGEEMRVGRELASKLSIIG